jgi:hypothetical protein
MNARDRSSRPGTPSLSGGDSEGPAARERKPDLRQGGRSGPHRRWSKDQVKLLTERKKLAWAAQHAYFERASILNALNYLIGVPVVLITALSASEIVISRAVEEPIPLYVGFITVSATVLASLQTFFRFGERGAFSANAGHRYALLRRRIENALASPPAEPDEELNEIWKEMEKAGEQSPPIGERRWLTWEAYARKEQVPKRRRWWRALMGIPEYESRRSRRASGDTVNLKGSGGAQSGSAAPPGGTRAR